MRSIKVKFLFFIIVIILNFNTIYSIDVKEISRDRIIELREKEKKEILEKLSLKNDLTNPYIKWFKLKLEEDQKQKCLYFSEIKQIFEVYKLNFINENIVFEKIYHFGNLEKPEYQGNPFHIICPENEDVLYFRIFSFDTYRLGITGKILSGSKEDFYIYIIKKEFIQILLGIMYILTGIISLFFFLFYKQYKFFLHFGIFVFFLGMASFTTNNIKYIYIQIPIFWSWINITSLFMVTIYSLIFISEIAYNKYKKFIVYIFFGELISGFLFLFISIGKNYYLFKLLIIIAYMVILNSFICIFYILYSIIKQKEKDLILFLIGLFILTIGAILDSIVVLRKLEYNSLYFNISMFIFLIVLIFILLKKQNQLLKKLEKIKLEFDLANNVYKNLLPRVSPEFINLKILFDYQPSYYFGGDFIQFIKINEKKLGVFLSDISGHGLSAALFSSTIMNNLNLLNIYYLQPSILLKKLNEILYDNFSSNFMTAIYVLIDLENHKFLYSSAGHNSVFYVQKNKVYFLESTGPAVGVLPHLNISEIEYPIVKDSFLFLYTDGYSEIYNSKEEMLTEIGLLQKFLSIKPFEKINYSNNLFNLLKQELIKWNKNKFYDDQAAVLIYFNNL